MDKNEKQNFIRRFITTYSVYITVLLLFDLNWGPYPIVLSSFVFAIITSVATIFFSNTKK